MDIDLRSTEVNVKFLRNTTIALTFYYLGVDGSVMDLTGYTGDFVVTDPNTGLPDTLWSQTPTIATGNTTFNKLPVTGAQGVYVEVPPTTTKTALDILRYECLLVSPTGIRIPLSYGSLIPFE